MPPQEEHWSKARLFAQPFMRDVAQRFDVAQWALNELRDAGISYRRTDMLSDWRREKGLVLNEVPLGRLLPDTQPDKSLFTDTPWPGLTTSLLYEFRVTGIDDVTKGSFTRFVSVGTDELLTVGEAQRAFEEEYLKEKLYGEISKVKMALVSVRHKTGSEYLS